ncbi:hypothetical protein K432DRAFT_444447 [Lepidopterella palustris CBS 459.81]|uniref:Lysine-specific metallo-endopeptidase domain-containing protein n=1 Tax=Lepidopterella palustris CBS 459.81 TaxID=1314670 RepID=A0A8E2JDQ5_9PEZI|nr:hypothetical protein K432DRAFT_444447 [Lepidopterella palustris CBS 459.81]
MDYAGYYKADGPERADRTQFISKTDYACTVDVCTWFTKMASDGEWEKIDAERIKLVIFMQDEGFLKEGKSGIDTLKNIGSTMLHELTHTIQGGRSEDIGSDCYGWKCVMNLHNPRNADTLAILGVALKVWSLGYYVDFYGTINPLSAA